MRGGRETYACVSESNAVPYPHTVMIILSVSSFPDAHFQNAFTTNGTVLTALVDVGVTQSAMPPPLFHAIGRTLFDETSLISLHS